MTHLSRSFSPDELSWIEARKSLPRKELHALFCDRFNRADITLQSIKSLCLRKGWLTGRGSKKCHNGTRYSDAELEWIEAHKELPRKELLAAFCRQFQRENTTFQGLNSLCKRKGWHGGSEGRASSQFKKGYTPYNKGHFESGEFVDSEGYVFVRLVGGERAVRKHRHLWEQVNGPVPAGMCLKCLDGDKQNTDPSNWDAVPWGVLPHLNGCIGRDYESAPPEIKPAILMVAKLLHKAAEVRQQHGVSQDQDILSERVTDVG